MEKKTLICHLILKGHLPAAIYYMILSNMRMEGVLHKHDKDFTNIKKQSLKQMVKYWINFH